MMFRSCDGESNNVRRLYHSGETTDIDFIVRGLIRAHPDLHLLICGVSLGGNVTLKWLGEQATNLPPQVKRAAAISVPFDLEEGSVFMEHGFSRVYVRHFLQSLREKTLRKMERYPDLCNRELLMGARTFRDFDNLVTGPVHGFTDAHDYYTKSSSIGFIDKIQIDTLLLSAWDDPFLPKRVLERVRDIARANPRLFLEFSERGGHVGSVEGQPWAQNYYVEKRAIAWLANEVLHL